MGLGDVWNRTLVYFGIAEDEEWDDDLTATNEEVDRDYRRRERANVRRLPRRREEDSWSEDSVSEPEQAADPTPPRSQRRSRLRSAAGGAGGQLAAGRGVP